MTARSTRGIQRALLAKGFLFRDSHHRLLELFIDGEPTGITTFLSHGVAEYGDNLLAQMARQLHLLKRELLDLIDCRMSGEQYIALLETRGELPR